jgi:cell shape-determining protein MreC
MARTTPTFTPIGKYALAFLISLALMVGDLSYGTFSPLRGFFKASSLYSQLIVSNLLNSVEHTIASFQDKKSLLRSNEMLRTELLQMQTKDFLKRQSDSISNDLIQLEGEFQDLIKNIDVKIFKIASFGLKNYLCCSAHELYLLNPQKLEIGQNLPVSNGKSFIGQTAGKNFSLIKVIMLSDIDHVLPVKSKNLFCNARGAGKPLFISCITDDHEDLNGNKVNDPIFTSGLGGIFPRDVLVGTISSITELSLERHEIMIKLAANPLNENYLGILVGS